MSRLGRLKPTRATTRPLPLPVDPEWKSQYASSVRRQVRDGVDSPLANSFVRVAATPPPHAKGADRARSATEAFLYRRLETLTETAGKFHLNVELLPNRFAEGFFQRLGGWRIRQLFKPGAFDNRYITVGGDILEFLHDAGRPANLDAIGGFVGT